MKNSAIIFIGCSFLVCSCGTKEGSLSAESPDFVAQYRDSVLLMPDILRRIPEGISSADSTAMIRSIADSWIDGFIIEDLAASQIDDMDRIEQLTAEYRRSLIADSYRRKMRAKGVQPVDTAAVSRYYRQHYKTLKLERPIIKGLFMKVPTSSRHIEEIRTLMANPGPEAYDALENAGRREATTFRYFAEQWVDFDAIAEQMPFRFADADATLKENADFETELNGTTYILHVTDFRPTGAVMPEAYAAPIIEDRMKANNLAIYEAGLIKALRKTAIEKKILKEGTYYN